MVESNLIFVEFFIIIFANDKLNRNITDEDFYDWKVHFIIFDDINLVTLRKNCITKNSW